MNKILNKPIVFCGVTDMNGEPVKMSKEEQEEFTKLVAGNEFNAVFCEDNTIPRMMRTMILKEKIKLYNKYGKETRIRKHAGKFERV